MLIGAATKAGNGSDYAALEKAAGPFTSRRSYNGEKEFPATYGVPTSFAASNASIDWDGTKTRYVSVYSFKPDIVRMGSGALDAAVNAFLASIPAGHKMILTVWHEADGKLRDKLFTIQQWKDAFTRFCTLVHRHNNANLYTSLTLEAYQPSTPGTLYADLWPGRGFADCLLFDGYSDLGSAGAVWDKGRLFAKSHGLPWGIAEAGVKSGSVTPAWMAEQVGYAQRNGAIVLCWFNTTTGNVLATPGSNALALNTAAALSISSRIDPTSFTL